MARTSNRLPAGAGFAQADARTRTARAANRLGVLAEIGVKATMKSKLDVEVPAYRVVGACNPKMAHHTIGMERRVDAMLRCDVTPREVERGVEISAFDPVASMQAIDNAELTSIAGQVRGLLANAEEI